MNSERWSEGSNGSDAEDGLIEQVPHYTLTTLDDGSSERLQLIVELPGVETSAGLIVEIGGNRAFVHLPGRYRLDVLLGVTVADKATKLRFVKNRQYLKAEYEVIARLSASAKAPDAQTAGSAPSSPPAPNARPGINTSKPRANGVHNSFLEDALKLRDSQRPATQGPKHSSRRTTFSDENAVNSSSLSGNSEAAKRRDAASSAQQNGHRNEFAHSHASSTASTCTHFPAGGRPGRGNLPGGSASSDSNGTCGPSIARSSEDEAASEEGDDDVPDLMSGEPEDDSTLYENALRQANQEAAGDCASIAEDALAQKDYDKAERMLQKAERLAPGMYADKLASVQRRKAARDAEAQRKTKEEEKRRKREADKQKRAEKERKAQEAAEAKRRAAEGEARRRAQAKEFQDKAKQAPPDDEESECGDGEEEDYMANYNWGFNMGKVNLVISLLYMAIALATVYCLGRRSFMWLQKRRFGTHNERVATACGVIVIWTVAICCAYRYTWWLLRAVWVVWCWIFWRPPLSAGIIETILLGLLCLMVPCHMTTIFCLPLMWHWVGGGFSALAGLASCFMGILILENVAGQATGATYMSLLGFRVAMPLLYIPLARWTGFWGQAATLVGCVVYIYRHRKNLCGGYEDGPRGQAYSFASASCRPEPVPEGAAPEVARVLQASTWYEVLEVSTSATDDEVRRAHKTKSLLTHPDKLGANDVGAHDAVIRVNAARDVLSDAVKRKQYDAELSGAAHAEREQHGRPGQSRRSTQEEPFSEYTGRRQPCTRKSEHSPACVCMPCKVCPRWHHVHIINRPRNAAFTCASCQKPHPGKHRQFWEESTGFGIFGSKKVYMYRPNMVLDITDVIDNCPVWGVLRGKTEPPSCSHGAMVFPPEVSPITEECFESFERARDEPRGQNQRAGRRKGGRRRH